MYIWVETSNFNLVAIVLFQHPKPFSSSIQQVTVIQKTGWLNGNTFILWQEEFPIQGNILSFLYPQKEITVHGTLEC